MIILSNCLTGTADEGSLKVANSLIKRMKKAAPDTTVVAYERQTPISDRYIPINKLMWNTELIRLLRSKKEPVLYMPFPARMLSTAIRTFILSRFARWGLQLVMVMQGQMGCLAKGLLKASGAQVVTLSRDTWGFYRDLIGERAVYLQTGVDTERFCPVSQEEKKNLRKKYGLPQDKPVVLHVGHLKAGRNLEHLLKLDAKWHVVLITSTWTASQRDMALHTRLKQKENMTLLECYQPNIEELYQLADVYMFPVVDAGNCIDVPLSALEAAACGIPVVTTPYGEMKELINQKGFYFLESFEPAKLDDLLQKAVAEGENPRPSVLAYDWNIAVNQLLMK